MPSDAFYSESQLSINFLRNGETSAFFEVTLPLFWLTSLTSSPSFPHSGYGTGRISFDISTRRARIIRGSGELRAQRQTDAAAES